MGFELKTHPSDSVGFLAVVNTLSFRHPLQLVSGMDSIPNLDSLGLALPSAAYLAGAVLFGLLGYAAFRFGRSQGRTFYLWGGLALMLYPYGVSDTWLLWLLGVGLCALMFAADRWLVGR